MQIVAAVSRKGGVGKTSIAVNLAALLASSRRQVALLDGDPQLSASRWIEQNKDGLPFSVYPADLSGAIRLQAQIQSLGGVDLVIIDTPPEIQAAAATVLLLADLALVPVTPSPLDLWAAQDAVDLAKKARKERNGKLPLVSLVPYRLTRTRLARDLQEALKTEGEAVAPGIGARIAVAESAIVGESVSDYAPRSLAADEFRSLARHVLTRLRKAHA